MCRPESVGRWSMPTARSGDRSRRWATDASCDFPPPVLQADHLVAERRRGGQAILGPVVHELTTPIEIGAAHIGRLEFRIVMGEGSLESSFLVAGGPVR